MELRIRRNNPIWIRDIPPNVCIRDLIVLTQYCVDIYKNHEITQD